MSFQARAGLALALIAAFPAIGGARAIGVTEVERRPSAEALRAEAGQIRVANNAATDAIVGAALGAVVAGAIVASSNSGHSSSNNHHHEDKKWFSPAPGIKCYDHAKSCYHDGGGFSPTWTRRVYD